MDDFLKGLGLVLTVLASGWLKDFIADWKKKAEGFIDSLNDGVKFHQLEKAKEDLELKMMEQADLIKTLSDRLNAVEKDKPKAKD